MAGLLHPTTFSMMTLPPWAYRQRQELSPIQLEGVIATVQSSTPDCLVTMQVSSISRNTSPVVIHAGDRIQIRVIAEPAPLDASPGGAPPARLGAPQQRVVIPGAGQRASAWLRPSPQHHGQFDLMAGPYGFGPDLTDDGGS